MAYAWLAGPLQGAPVKMIGRRTAGDKPLHCILSKQMLYDKMNNTSTIVCTIGCYKSIFIGPKSNHCLALSVSHSSCWDLTDVTLVCEYDEQNQADIGPQVQNLLKFLLRPKSVDWVKILTALDPLCLCQCLH